MRANFFSRNQYGLRHIYLFYQLVKPTKSTARCMLSCGRPCQMALTSPPGLIQNTTKDASCCLVSGSAEPCTTNKQRAWRRLTCAYVDVSGIVVSFSRRTGRCHGARQNDGTLQHMCLRGMRVVQRAGSQERTGDIYPFLHRSS
jgi:hypothetical protein